MEQHDTRVGAFRDEKRTQQRRAVGRRPGEQFPPHLCQRDTLVRGERGDYVVRVASVASLGGSSVSDVQLTRLSALSAPS